MCYLNTAFLLADDPTAANAALDVAELHLAHTLRRTQMAVQMAAAIRQAEQQQQQLMQWQAQCMQTDDGEEVCSGWRPSRAQAAG
jgi:hypothetical protein